MYKGFDEVMRAAFDAGRESTSQPLHRADAEYQAFRDRLAGWEREPVEA